MERLVWGCYFVLDRQSLDTIYSTFIRLSFEMVGANYTRYEKNNNKTKKTTTKKKKQQQKTNKQTNKKKKKKKKQNEMRLQDTTKLVSSSL